MEGEELKGKVTMKKFSDDEQFYDGNEEEEEEVDNEAENEDDEDQIPLEANIISSSYATTTTLKDEKRSDNPNPNNNSNNSHDNFDKSSIGGLNGSSDLLFHNSIVKSGYVLKRVKRGLQKNTWHRRWLVLRGDSLCYYSDDKEYECLRVIKLCDILSVAKADSGKEEKAKKWKNVFGVVTAKRTFYFKALVNQQESQKQHIFTQSDEDGSISGESSTFGGSVSSSLANSDTDTPISAPSPTKKKNIKKQGAASKSGAYSSNGTLDYDGSTKDLGKISCPLELSHWLDAFRFVINHKGSNTNSVANQKGSNTNSVANQKGSNTNSVANQKGSNTNSVTNQKESVTNPVTSTNNNFNLTSSSDEPKNTLQIVTKPNSNNPNQSVSIPSTSLPSCRTNHSEASADSSNLALNNISDQPNNPSNNANFNNPILNNMLDASDSLILVQGYLMKLGVGSVKKWKKRWFVLRTGGKLYYYKDEKEYELHRVINLNSEVLDILALPQGTHKSHDFCLQLVTNKRSFIIACRDENELDLWLSNLVNLHRALRLANGTFPDELSVTKSLKNSGVKDDEDIFWETESGAILKFTTICSNMPVDEHLDTFRLAIIWAIQRKLCRNNRPHLIMNPWHNSKSMIYWESRIFAIQSLWKDRDARVLLIWISEIPFMNDLFIDEDCCERDASHHGSKLQIIGCLNEDDSIDEDDSISIDEDDSVSIDEDDDKNNNFDKNVDDKVSNSPPTKILDSNACTYFSTSNLVTVTSYFGPNFHGKYDMKRKPDFSIIATNSSTNSSPTNNSINSVKATTNTRIDVIENEFFDDPIDNMLQVTDEDFNFFDKNDDENDDENDVKKSVENKLIYSSSPSSCFASLNDDIDANDPIIMDSGFSPLSSAAIVSNIIPTVDQLILFHNQNSESNTTLASSTPYSGNNYRSIDSIFQSYAIAANQEKEQDSLTGKKEQEEKNGEIDMDEERVDILPMDLEMEDIESNFNHNGNEQVDEKLVLCLALSQATYHNHLTSTWSTSLKPLKYNLDSMVMSILEDYPWLSVQKITDISQAYSLESTLLTKRLGDKFTIRGPSPKDLFQLEGAFPRISVTFMDQRLLLESGNHGTPFFVVENSVFDPIVLSYWSFIGLKPLNGVKDITLIPLTKDPGLFDQIPCIYAACGLGKMKIQGEATRYQESQFTVYLFDSYEKREKVRKLIPNPLPHGTLVKSIFKATQDVTFLSDRWSCQRFCFDLYNLCNSRSSLGSSIKSDLYTSFPAYNLYFPIQGDLDSNIERSSLLFAFVSRCNDGGLSLALLSGVNGSIIRLERRLEPTQLESLISEYRRGRYELFVVRVSIDGCQEGGLTGIVEEDFTLFPLFTSGTFVSTPKSPNLKILQIGKKAFSSPPCSTKSVSNYFIYPFCCASSANFASVDNVMTPLYQICCCNFGDNIRDIDSVVALMVSSWILGNDAIFMKDFRPESGGSSISLFHLLPFGSRLAIYLSISTIKSW